MGNHWASKSLVCYPESIWAFAFGPRPARLKSNRRLPLVMFCTTSDSWRPVGDLVGDNFLPLSWGSTIRSNLAYISIWSCLVYRSLMYLQVVALCLARINSITSAGFGPMLSPCNHYPRTIDVLLYSQCGPFFLLIIPSFMANAWVYDLFSLRLIFLLPLYIFTSDGVKTISPPMTNTSTRETELMDSLITHRLFKPTNLNCRDERLINVYLNT